jgi:hypothetical protein
MKGRTATLTKSSGVTEEVPFQILPVDQAAMVKLERENAELRQALAKSKLDKLSDRDRAAVARTCATLSLRKGLYEVGYLGNTIESLAWLCMQSEWERDLEGDDSKVPEDLREAWKALLETFKAMATEEADEMAAQGGKGEKSMKIVTQADLTKAAKTIGEHLAKHMEMHKALHEKLEGTLHKEHPIMKAHAAMMDHCEKCMKAAKDAGAGEQEGETEAEKTARLAAEALAKQQAAAADPTGQIALLTKANEELAAKFEALMKKLETTPAGGAPHTGALGKREAAAAGFDALLSPEVTH